MRTGTCLHATDRATPVIPNRSSIRVIVRFYAALMRVCRKRSSHESHEDNDEVGLIMLDGMPAEGGGEKEVFMPTALSALVVERWKPPQLRQILSDGMELVTVPEHATSSDVDQRRRD